MGGTAQTGTITLGSSTGTNIVAIGAGTGATTVNIATGATNAKTVNIATGAVANTLAIGSSSATTVSITDDNWSITAAGLFTTANDAAINGGDITSTASTFNLLNATPTTLNIGGAATTVSLGASSGTTTVNNALTVTLAFTANGDVDLGNANTDTISFVGDIDTDITFDPGATRTVTIRTDNTAGDQLSITGGSGGTGDVAGGIIAITAGAGGTGSTGGAHHGGDLTITGGAAGTDGAGAGTGGTGGDVTVTGGAAADSGNNAGGNVVFVGGAATGSGAIGIVQVGSPTVGSTRATNLFAVAGGLEVDGVSRFDNEVIFGTDNTNDIGASGATRPRTGYFGTSVIIGDTITIDTDSVDASAALTLTTGSNGALTLTPNGSGDVVFSVDDDTELDFTATLTNTGQMLDLNLTLGNDTGVDTVSALDIAVTSAVTGDADILLGLNIANLASADGTVVEKAIQIGTGWDTDIAFTDTSPTITIGNTGTLTITDGTNTLFSIADDTAEGDVTITGDLAVNGATSADITSTTTTATILNTTVTTLSIGGATTTFNLGDAATTQTIDIGGVSADGTTTINVATEGTSSDTVAVGNTNASTTVAITGGDDWSIAGTGVLTLSASAAATTAIVVTDTDYTNALSIGDNNITGTTFSLTGTTAVINFTDFDVDADGKVIIAPDVAGDALTINFGAADDFQAIVVDAATNDSTQTAGIIDLNVDTATSNAIGGVALSMNIRDAAGNLTIYGNKTDITVDTDAAQSHTVYGEYIGITANDASSATYGLAIIAEDAGGQVVTAGLLIQNLQATDIDLTDGILVQATTNASIVDAIDVSDAEITNALNVGANVILGTGGASINFDEFGKLDIFYKMISQI